MENMLPGNSFPQICVVSVNKSEEKLFSTQEHPRTAAKSNTQSLLIGNGAQSAILPAPQYAGKRIKDVYPAFESWIRRWVWQRNERETSGPVFRDESRKRENRKKRSSRASWKTCCLGTPFPRSALFL